VDYLDSVTSQTIQRAVAVYSVRFVRCSPFQLEECRYRKARNGCGFGVWVVVAVVVAVHTDK
jgi:hypothetical protein